MRSKTHQNLRSRRPYLLAEGEGNVTINILSISCARGEKRWAGFSGVRWNGGGYEFDRPTEKVSEYPPAYCWEEGSMIKKEGHSGKMRS